MKFSEVWLREWVNPAVSTIELTDQLSMAGLEVDSVEPVAGQFSGVVVGEVLTANNTPMQTSSASAQLTPEVTIPCRSSVVLPM